MSEASQSPEELVDSFANITGVDAERARFYLEASNWQLQTALGSFFEGEQDDDSQGASNDGAADVLPPNITQDRSVPASAPGAVGNAPVPNRTSGSSRGGLATIDSIRSQPDASDDEEKGQAFYAGGSQSSGQQVLGPPPKKRSELVAEMFQKAREHGAEEVSGGGAPGVVRKPGGNFSGTGYKLGESSGAGAEVVPSDSVAEPESRRVVLRLWSTGFTLNDGPLREYQDPANQEFLRSVKQGELPRELIRDNMGFEVDLIMEDRHHEDYAPPKATVQPFFGKGNVLGSPAPATIGSVGPTSAADREANETEARNQLAFQENEPSTNIQVRLADGTRLVVKVNHTHTINDLHNFINIARPQFSASNYVLTLFPNKELTKKDETVKEANLLNSAVIQKLK